MEYIQDSKKKKSISQVILECIEKIFEISTHEFTGGYHRFVLHGNIKEKEYVPSPREAYIQSVRNLAYILTPFFDETMSEKYKDIMKKVDNIFQEIKDKMKKQIEEDWVEGSETQEDLNKKLKEVDNLKRDDKTNYAISQRKLKLMEDMFIEINQLLSRKDYLKGEIYVDKKDDDDDEGVDAA